MEARWAAGHCLLLLETQLLRHRGAMRMGGERQLCSATAGHRSRNPLWLPGEGSATLTALWAPARRSLLPTGARVFTPAAPLSQLHSRNIREGRAHT